MLLWLLMPRIGSALKQTRNTQEKVIKMNLFLKTLFGKIAFATRRTKGSKSMKCWLWALTDWCGRSSLPYLFICLQYNPSFPALRLRVFVNLREPLSFFLQNHVLLSPLSSLGKIRRLTWANLVGPCGIVTCTYNEENGSFLDISPSGTCPFFVSRFSLRF